MLDFACETVVAAPTSVYALWKCVMALINLVSPPEVIGHRGTLSRYLAAGGETSSSSYIISSLTPGSLLKVVKNCAQL